MTEAGEHDRRAQLTLWAQEARGRSAACTAQAVSAASSADVLGEQANRVIERLAERNPQSAEQLLAISATAARRRAAIAERKRNFEASRAGARLLIRPQQPAAAIIPELEAYLREMATIQERDRIAAELQARVIQRVFAAGLALQCAAWLTTQPEVRTRIEAAADGLDETIRIIRDAIFGAADRPADREPRPGPQTTS